MTEPREQTEAEFDTAIGRVVRAAAHLERALRFVHGDLLQSPFGQDLSDGMPTEQLLQGISRLAGMANTVTVYVGPPLKPVRSDHLARFQECVTIARGLLDLRHQVVHGDWSAPGLDPDAPYRVTELVRRKSRERREWTLANLTTLAADLRQLEPRLMRVHAEMHGFDPTLLPPEKPWGSAISEGR